MFVVGGRARPRRGGELERHTDVRFETVALDDVRRWRWTTCWRRRRRWSALRRARPARADHLFITADPNHRGRRAVRPQAGAGSVVNRCGGGWSAVGRRAVRPPREPRPDAAQIDRIPRLLDSHGRARPPRARRAGRDLARVASRERLRRRDIEDHDGFAPRADGTEAPAVALRAAPD